MPQNTEATAFLSRVAQLPPGLGVSLDACLEPSLQDEATLRGLFAQSKQDPRLEDPYVGLVDIFDAPASIRTTRARVVANEQDLNAKYILPLTEDQRRKEGTPCMVDTFGDFTKNWSIFTENSLSQLTNWDNVVAAGGAVQACLSPVPEEFQVSKRSLRKYFHSQAFPTSDVDLFLYGLTPEQAEVRINEIYEAVRDSIPWDVTCIRTKHTISIHSQYPYRAVQIVLRLYQSPAEILAGFDVDAPCCIYDGRRVWANPRAIVAMMRQCNTVDITRRSPSYEVRLHKYSARGFEVYVPDLKREDIDPTIFERSIVRIQGLARLLVLERLATAISRDNYLLARRTLRGRPEKNQSWKRHAKKKYKGDLKQDADSGLELSDYDVVSLHIPYGPGWDARRIDRLIYQTDLGMNSPYNPRNKDRRLHRHAAFFGTMKECLDDCCECCPEPETDNEKTLREEEDKSYVRGRVSFIEEDPGRQSVSGSFHPIDEGEWSEQAYIGAVDRFFAAIAAHDRETVKRMLREGSEVDRRDHVGRTPLQVAVMAKAEDIACDLIEAGARMTCRLVDGRTALHMAAQLNLVKVIRKLLERSALNEEELRQAEEEKKAEAKKAAGKSGEAMDTSDNASNPDSDHDSSGDDWSSGGGGDDEDDEVKNDTTDEGLAIPEDEDDEPDVFDLNAQDWDYGFTALSYAVVAGALPAIEVLLSAGADPKINGTLNIGYGNSRRCHPLILTTAIDNDEDACKVAKRLIAAGLLSSEADDNLYSTLHRLVAAAQPKLLAACLQADPNAKAVIDIPWVDDWNGAIFPIVTAVASGCYAVLAILLAYGAKLVITEDQFERGRQMKLQHNGRAPTQFSRSVVMPLEVALGSHDDVAHLLVALGAEINHCTKDTASNTVLNGRMSFLDYVRLVSERISRIVSEDKAQEASRKRKRTDTDVFSPNFGTRVQNPLAMQGPPHAGHPMLLGAAQFAMPNTASAPLLQTALVTSVPDWRVAVQKILSICTAALDRQTADSQVNYNNNRPPLDHYIELKKWMDEMDEVLVAHGGMTALELSPAEISEAQRKEMLLNRINDHRFYRYGGSLMNIGSCSFWQLGHNRLGNVIGLATTLSTIYTELFTACWEGNNAKIEELCLPQKASKNPDLPVAIGVRWGDNWKGFNPLTIAFMRRHWDTARLILAIATAQYDPKTPAAKPYVPPRNLVLEEDDHDEADGSEDEDEDEDMEYEEPQPVDFIDIAKRHSAVKSGCRAHDLLLDSTLFMDPRTDKQQSSSLVHKVVVEDDFEAFIQILDLCNYLQTEDNKALQSIGLYNSLIVSDRPAMLDEYIRRTGEGVSFDAEHLEAEDEPSAVSKKSKKKDYLGLNVHGKKRKDLARRADPDAPQEVTYEDIPLLWALARNGRASTIKYFASEKPLEAYKFYASSHSDRRARQIQKITDLAAVIPAKLGWSSNQFNESVLTAAVIANQREVLETLFEVRPAQMEKFVHLKHFTLGFNLLHAAVRYGCDTWMIDFLLGKKVSPMDVDKDGRNVYHLACVFATEQTMKLLKHLLHQLPKDMTQHLLRQQSKTTGNTPLHIAVKQGRLDLVRLLIETGAAQYTQRDGNGCTALHVAVKLSHPEMTRIIAEAGPEELLTLEDGVGTTPLETAVRQNMVARLNKPTSSMTYPQHLAPQVDWSKPFDVKKQEKQLPLLRDTIQSLLDEGRLVNGTKLTKELVAFADRLEAKIQRVKAEEEAAETEDKEKKWVAENDTSTTGATLRALMEALAARSGQRRLVHISDVQASVSKALEEHEKEEEPQRGRRYYRRARHSRRQGVTDYDDDEEEAPQTSALTQDYLSDNSYADVWRKL